MLKEWQVSFHKWRSIIKPTQFVHHPRAHAHREREEKLMDFSVYLFSVNLNPVIHITPQIIIFYLIYHERLYKPKHKFNFISFLISLQIPRDTSFYILYSIFSSSFWSLVVTFQQHWLNILLCCGGQEVVCMDGMLLLSLTLPILIRSSSKEML